MTREKLGTILLLSGVAAWLTYFSLKAILPDAELPFGLFLAWHLSGVIPGMLLRGSKLVKLLKNSLQSEPDPDPASADAK